MKNALFESFTYKIPDRLLHFVKEGYAVYVPLKNSIQIGFVRRLNKDQLPNIPENKIKEVLDVFPINPIFEKNMFELLLWISDYYIEPPGSVLFSAIPSGLFKLSQYRVVFKDNSQRGDINILSREYLKRRYGLSLVDIFSMLKDDDVRLSVSQKGEFEGNVVVFLGDNLGDGNKEELDKIVKRYPIIEVFLKELNKRRSIPLFDVLTILRDKRLLRYLYKMGVISIQENNSLSSVYRVSEPSVIHLTDEQKNTIEKIDKERANGFGVHYIYGVTGSGKTEVYLRVANKVISENKGVIFLVPEIALTPQSIYRIRVALGCDVAVLHSGLGEKERIKEYLRIKNNDVKVVVGARSAIFAPLNNLGLIVVDEEHDSAYKQEESPRYNGRDIAIKRGQIENCMVILGSATPSVQSIYNIKTGRYEHSKLSIRANKKPLPEIEIVSLTRSDEKKDDVEGLPFFISERLYRALLDTVSNDRKAILMLNRRGFNTIVICSKCGYFFKCPNCDVNLIYHKKEAILLCHYCSFLEKFVNICPKCNSINIQNFGFGTEQVEEVVSRLIPNAKTIRLDRDSVSNLYDLESIISKFSRGEANILIGTQMVAKGHHFPDVTLVGVILAETAFFVPDFRVQERLMQLLMQVSGRAGRGEEKGVVIIQTFNPFEPSILAVKNGNIDEYLDVELKRRKNLFYPPFSKIILIRARSIKEERCVNVLQVVKDHLVHLKRSEVLGPVPSFVKKMKNEYRYQLMIKTAEGAGVRKILKNVIPNIYKKHPNVRVFVDVDPINML
ncbi:MAG: primosomal protein N' [Deltaproteobacteria bacterium]|nr:primosomal protein N' [Deltaproteobacteria bacterium]